MTRALSVMFTCLALLGAPIAGQDKPNFAGTWKLSDPATPEMFTPTAMTVVQYATAMTVTTTSQMGSSRPPTSWMAARRRVPCSSTG